MSQQAFLGCILKRHSPTVIYTCNRWLNVESNSPLISVLDALSEQRVILIMGIWWTIEPGVGNPERFSTWVKSLHDRYPNLSILLCANSSVEYDVCQNYGMNAILANQNMFLDERIFKPLPGLAKVHDAIYNAQYLPFKRHELLSQTSSVALIGYNVNANPKYIESITSVLDKATQLNLDESGNFRFLNGESCNVAYNVSGSGLCLSEAEGAMYASMEYLMSGLFLISTKSRGGRDFFFDDRNCLIVDAEAGAIAEAVKHVNETNPDRSAIRDRVLLQVREERSKFIKTVDELIEHEGGGSGHLLNNWSSVYTNKLLKNIPISEVILECKTAASGNDSSDSDGL